MRTELDDKLSHYHAYMTNAERWRILKGFAYSNRHGLTKAENALWQLLRSNILAPRSRRQHAIERYIVDFTCLPAWLIIEVDGEYHFEVEQAQYDGGRTHDLQELGFHNRRFTNEEVLQHPTHILNLISTYLNNYLPSPKSSGSPSPQGEGAGG
ncbi:hypothetical protein BEN47_02015 [Hymenobacter lapidarius]|uniref:DUF559 domain-containing protein n=1 Tax=Hymenobacter lapidarius TaxID=1908237 RepID=A0A1G1T2N6_9BACT|nr:endonuclease domain-containing protein [Hymenobacter lapidarius]OGX85133.1 hypothetical protein BEN47_02015 [Hymenobacter lapidarius]